jgi:putative OPT family oligopeptide transporter
MTLIVSSFVLVNAGLSGPMGMASALVIGGVVCTALSVAGGFITDLKVGYWIGTTPIKQQMWKFLGVFVSAATVGLVIFILAKAYGFVQTPETPNPLVAPQANAMAAVIEPLMQPGAQINWILYVVGAIISFLVYLLGISPLAFALGMFIPQELNTPLIVGGLIHHFMNKSSDDKELVNARVQRGTLISSGFIAGAALFGVVGALLLFFGFDMDMKVWDEGHLGGEWTALLAFAVILLYFIWDSRRAKV